MSLQNWLNGDNWAQIRDKFNAITTILKGGDAGKVLTGTGVGSDPAWQNLPSPAYPDQSGNAGKFLGTDGTNVSWQSVSGRDLKQTNASPGVNVPTSGTESKFGSLTASVNGKYLILGTITFNRITTSPETQWRIYKNNNPIISYLSVAIPNDGHTQTLTITWMEDSVAIGDVFELGVYSPSNQVNLQNYTLIIDGNQ